MEDSAVPEIYYAHTTFRSASTDMSFTAEAVNADIRRRVVETIAGVREGSVKGRLRAAARLLGLPVDRVRRYLYGEVKRIEAHEAFQILTRADEAKRKQFQRVQHEYEALRLELGNSAPSRLAFLVPPSVAPLPDIDTELGDDI